MRNTQEVEKFEFPVRAVVKGEPQRRPHKNLTRFWQEHEEDYLEIDEFFGK